MLTNSRKPSMAGDMLEYQLLNDLFSNCVTSVFGQRNILIVPDSILQVFIRYMVL